MFSIPRSLISYKLKQIPYINNLFKYTVKRMVSHSKQVYRFVLFFKVACTPPPSTSYSIFAWKPLFSRKPKYSRYYYGFRLMYVFYTFCTFFYLFELFLVYYLYSFCIHCIYFFHFLLKFSHMCVNFIRLLFYTFIHFLCITNVCFSVKLLIA